VLWDKPSTSPAINLDPEELDINTLEKRVFHQIAYLHSPSTWATSLTAHIRETHPEPYSVEAPILVALQPPLLLQWPLTYETPAFTENFGLLLKFKPEIRHLAASILYGLDKVHKLHYDPLYDATAIQPNMFYGAHLRTGPDAISAGWTPYKKQSQHYLWDAVKTKASLIYVASDDKEDTWLFAQEANDKGIKVTNALQTLASPQLQGELLAEHDLFEAWDSGFKSCVDWLILSRASHMGGTWESSFSWGIAMARHKGLVHPRWGLKPGITPAKGQKTATAGKAAQVKRQVQSKAIGEVVVQKQGNANADAQIAGKAVSGLRGGPGLTAGAKAAEIDLLDTDEADLEGVKEIQDIVDTTNDAANVGAVPLDGVKDGDGEQVAPLENDLEVNQGDSATKPITINEAQAREDEAAQAEGAPPNSQPVLNQGMEGYKPPPKKASAAQKVQAEAAPVAAAKEEQEVEVKEEVLSKAPPVVSSSAAEEGLPDPKWVKQAFGDGLSTIYGPEDEGEMFWGAMWP
jgi:hypothetical protein